MPGSNIVTQSDVRAVTALKNAHTILHNALDNYNNKSKNLGKQQACQALKYIAEALAVME